MIPIPPIILLRPLRPPTDAAGWVLAIITLFQLATIVVALAVVAYITVCEVGDWRRRKRCEKNKRSRSWS